MLCFICYDWLIDFLLLWCFLILLSQLRTLVPAYSSFQVDCGRILILWQNIKELTNIFLFKLKSCYAVRILRGIRIAARLGFSFAKDTEKAIHNFHDSVKTLDKVLEIGNLMASLGFFFIIGYFFALMPFRPF